MQQLALRALQVVVRLAQRGIGLAQLADRAAGNHHAHQLAGLRHARGAIHRHRHGRTVAGTQEEFAVMHSFPGVSGEHVARLGLFAVVGKKLEERGMHQLLRRLARNVAQRGIHFLDAAVAVADDQDVRHRGQDAFDELVRLFERGVFFFEGDLVLQEVVIDLVHLLDDFDPRRFAARRQRRLGHGISGRDGNGHGLRRVRRGRGDARLRARSR